MNRDELLKCIEKAACEQETKLDLAGQGIKELPPEIGQLTSLSELWLHENQLTSVPPEIGQLISLTSLDLQSNQLSSLLPEIGQLTSLRGLYLHANQLSSLPPEIGKLTSLTHLYLDGNKLTSLPPEIGQLTQLETLDLGDANRTNPLTTLPPELGRLEKLTSLKLKNLGLTDPPPEVVAQGTQAVLAYLREQLEEETPVWESRLLVVGEGGVGKTQILRALNGHEFQIGSETTHGIAVVPVRLEHAEREGVTMTLNAWDFGGQEVYHATHQFFLASRSLFLLAWNSRLGWEQGKLHNWLDTIKALAPESPVMLVATHLDERTADLPFDDLKQKYPQIIGEWSVSSLQRDLGDGIDGLRQALQTAAADLPLMGKPTPASFLNTTRVIRELKQTETWIPVSKLWEIMADHNVSEPARPVLARQLHELGELIHFHDDEELRETVLLDAEWVTRNISNVLEHEGIVDGLGIFRREHMDECWPTIDPLFARPLPAVDGEVRPIVPHPGRSPKHQSGCRAAVVRSSRLRRPLERQTGQGRLPRNPHEIRSAEHSPGRHSHLVHRPHAPLHNVNALAVWRAVSGPPTRPPGPDRSLTQRTFRDVDGPRP